MISNFTFSKALVAFFLVALVGCGGGNNIPPDADGDGIEDSLDAFPNDPTESTDGDDDGVGVVHGPVVDRDLPRRARAFGGRSDAEGHGRTAHIEADSEVLRQRVHARGGRIAGMSVVGGEPV